MLSQKEMVEKQEGVVKMTDVSVEALEYFLFFLYTGEIKEKGASRTKDPFWISLLPELVYMADKVRVIICT